MPAGMLLCSPSNSGFKSDSRSIFQNICLKPIKRYQDVLVRSFVPNLFLIVETKIWRHFNPFQSKIIFERSFRNKSSTKESFKRFHKNKNICSFSLALFKSLFKVFKTLWVCFLVSNTFSLEESEFISVCWQR